MIIKVTVQTKASSEKIEELGLEEYKIWVTVPPADNEANDAVIEVVADHFNVAPSLVHIRSGHKSRHKLIEIETA
jgi:uncharacterized protein (TIGR00251 family)